MKPIKGNYCDENSICPIVNDTTEGDWENEGGVVLPDVDDNTSREELDSWTKTTAKATAKGIAAKEDNWKERYKGYRKNE